MNPTTSELSTSSTKANTAKSHEALNTPLVSIVIPCYNCADFVGEAIESALAQDYPRIEVIVVDDGSQDESRDKIAKYPVHAFYACHEGVSAARNRGVRESHGEYVIFLDSDDRLLPKAVSIGLSALIDHPDCCMAVGAHNIMSQTGKFICCREKIFKTNDHYAHLLKSNFVECTSAAMLRREAASKVGWFDISLNAAEDYDLYLRLARAYPVICHPGIVTEYRLHQNNVSHKSALMLTDTLQVVRAQGAYAFTSFSRAHSYLYGSWLWRRKYGRQLTRELATVRATGTKRRTRQWLALLTAYPLGVLIAIVGRVLPKSVASSVLRRTNRLNPSI
jgi:glycosyltransferase involved in cell wall biosynthesis